MSSCVVILAGTSHECSVHFFLSIHLTLKNVFVEAENDKLFKNHRLFHLVIFPNKSLKKSIILLSNINTLKFSFKTNIHAFLTFFFKTSIFSLNTKSSSGQPI
jgi:hypothetical protein